MSVVVNDSIQSNSPKSLDNKYLNLGVGPYTDASTANSVVLSAYRSRGLTVNIGGAEYWYRDGIADVNLIPKGITTVVSPLVLDNTTNVLSIPVASNSMSGYLALGDWTTFNNKLSSVATAQSVANTGIVGNPITLVNDQNTPGATMYYGTNGSGIKGYYPIPVSSGGGGTAWGAITGTFSAQTDAYNLVQSKEPAIAAGTALQYWRGDKTWQTLNTTAVVEGSNQYFTTTRARTSISAGTGISYNSSTGVVTSTITQADGTETKLTAGTNIIITGTGSSSTPYVIGTSGGGTVTSIGLTSTDLSVSGSPVTGAGNITANLATTGVTAGSYTFTAITVDAKGRLTAATSGSLPVATSSILGAVKIGTNVSVAGDGTISVTFPSTVATSSVLGYVKIGSGVSVAGDGTISVAGYALPIASPTILGGIKVGSGLSIDGTGVLSVTSGGVGTVTSVALSSTDLGVSGSPITTAGTITANLNPTGVASGTYNTVTVDVKGRVTAATNTSYLTANQSITLSGDVTGTGTTAITTTLKTVNSNIGTFNTVTVNAKGLVTAASNTAYLTTAVTSFSAGNLSPLFTTSVATSTTTPSLSFALSNAGAHTFLGNNTGSTGSPAYVQPAFTDLSGNIAVAQLNSGTGASATTYFTGNNTWSTPLNIYNGNGTLSGARTITMSGNSLHLFGGNILIEGQNQNSLYIRGLADTDLGWRLGRSANNDNANDFFILNENSSYVVQINSSNKTTFNYPVQIADGTQGNGKVFTSDSSGNGSWVNPTIYSSGFTPTQLAGLAGTSYQSYYTYTEGVVTAYCLFATGNLSSSSVYTVEMQVPVALGAAFLDSTFILGQAMTDTTLSQCANMYISAGTSSTGSVVLHFTAISSGVHVISYQYTYFV